MSQYPLLETIQFPLDLRELSIEELPKVCNEVRDFIIDTLAGIGGHFASNLGVVELTVALHYVLNTPQDKLIWDVGHQTYPHKILTGRRDLLKTVRKYNGLSGFPKREESEYDLYNTGHAGTSISQALGEACARIF
jgi:1-deoxy-D-xylulose-5-phosphate synthase